MTNQHHPITPPPELRQLWAQQAQRLSPHDPVEWMQYVSEKAAQWGADQELEACCAIALVDAGCGTKFQRENLVWKLRAARRPKPPSLKEQALEDLEILVADLANHGMGFKATNIRRALEQLDG